MNGVEIIGMSHLRGQMIIQLGLSWPGRKERSAQHWIQVMNKEGGRVLLHVPSRLSPLPRVTILQPLNWTTFVLFFSEPNLPHNLLERKTPKFTFPNLPSSTSPFRGKRRGMSVNLNNQIQKEKDT